MASPAKKPRLSEIAGPAASGLAVMLIDVEEDTNGTLLLWGLAAEGTGGGRQQHQTVLLRVHDYQPYFFIPCPQVLNPSNQELQEPQLQDLHRLRRAINSRLPDEQHLEALEVLQLSPIMFYRPAQPEGLPYIKAYLTPGTSSKRAAAAVEKVAAGGIAGFSWRQRGTEVYEADVKLVMRFLSDTSLSGGSWLWACPTHTTHHTHNPRHNHTEATTTTTNHSSNSGTSTAAATRLIAAASQEFSGGSTSSGGGGVFELVPVGSSSRRSSCSIECVCSWRCLHSLTPDATQLALQDWQPQALTQLLPLPAQLSAAAASAAGGDILPLKLLVLDVLLAPADGSDRSTNPQTAPVVAIACQLTHTSSSKAATTDTHSQGPHTPETPAAAAAAAGADGGSSSGQQSAGVSGSGGGSSGGSSRVVFLLAGPGAAAVLPPELRAEGVVMRVCGSERVPLTCWRDWVQQQDPDGFVLFQVRDNLGVLAARFAALQVDGGSALLSRAAGRFSKPLTTKSVVQYSVAWAKSQSRMASTSNQETFKRGCRAGL